MNEFEVEGQVIRVEEKSGTSQGSGKPWSLAQVVMSNVETWEGKDGEEKSRSSLFGFAFFGGKKDEAFQLRPGMKVKMIGHLESEEKISPKGYPYFAVKARAWRWEVLEGGAAAPAASEDQVDEDNRAPF